jgi:hypothetical protein
MINEIPEFASDQKIARAVFTVRFSPTTPNTSASFCGIILAGFNGEKTPFHCTIKVPK